MKISANQINQGELAQFVVQTMTGGNFSGMLGAYLSAGGSLNSGVLTTTGGNQTVFTNVTFNTSPSVQYSGTNTGSAASQQWVIDYSRGLVYSLSGTITGGFVTLGDNQTINGFKQFTGNVGLLTPPTIGIHAVDLNTLSGVSGLLATVGGSAVSGVLNTTIFNTGAAAVSFATTYANSIGSSLSGALTASGQLLSAVQITGSSVNNVVNFTGLGGTLVFTSGGFTFISGAAGGGGGTVTQGQLDALSGALGASGSQLYNLVTGASGQADINFATIVNLALTGSNLYVLLTGASGQFDTNFATVANLFSTGSNLYQLATGMSGDLTTRDLNISGALQAQIAGANGTQVQVTGGGTMGFANFTGVGSVTIFNSGSTVYVSGTLAGAGDVTTAQLNSLSGFTTGASGFLQTQISVLPTAIQLAQTGSNLYVTMTGFSGQGVTDYATKTQLTNSGVTIEAQINSLSGFVLTQSAASGSQVRVTGSPNIAIADLSGVGGTLVYTLGSQILISGGGGSSSSSTNPVDFSFFLDPVYTGIGLLESFTSHSFNFTGAAFSCRTSGDAPANGGILSGKLYQIDTNNTEQTLYSFTFTTGIIYSGSPGFSTFVTGGNRIGLSITNSMSGIDRFSVGVFGGAYV